MKFTRVSDHKLPTGVLGLATTADGTRAYTACTDGLLYEVDLATGKAEPFATPHQSYASACVLLPGERTVISAGYDGQLHWHDVKSRTCFRRVKAHQFWNWQLALSPDGTRLATTTGQYLPGGWKYEPAPAPEPTVKVFDTETGDLLAAHAHTPPVLSCTFSPCGRYLAAGNIMGDVRIWDAEGATGDQPLTEFNSPDFTSWGTTKTHHYCGGIYGLAFAADGHTLLCCGMGPMGDPMAGNGKMTWQRWAWRDGQRLDQIKDGQHGNGLMETLAWHPAGEHFVMAGRQAQGTWNLALFATKDGALVHSLDTKKRITHVRFTPDGQSLILAGATGQPARKNNAWEAWGRVQVYKVEA